MTRREFLQGAVAVAGWRWIPLALGPGEARPFKMAVVADLHHGLAPDAMERLQAFVTEVKRRPKLDLVIQMGDFCHPEADSTDFAKLFRDLPQPKLHVLGNHDMDKGDKDAAMKFWGMKSRYGTYDAGDYLFVWMDLNHFKKDGKLVPYVKGNYFTDNATHNWADPEQLDWLGKELKKATKPVILLSHQPLGFPNGDTLPPEQVEVLKVITDAGKGKVAACLCGHMHLDWLTSHEGIPCYCVNSASYFWSQGMWPYTKPLYAFMEITTDGMLVVEGVSGEFAKKPPASSDSVIGRSASIAPEQIHLSGNFKMPKHMN